MATMSKVFDDSTSVSNPPPSYDSISTSAPADSVWYKRSVFSFLQPKQIPRATALSRIRDIVSSPDFTPSSVGPIVDSCAAALPVAEFSALLQRRNIEDHTALYWAIVKKRREALWAFTKFISEFSPACSSDLRLACLATNDHDLFMRLNLGDNVNPKDKSLRRMLGCPRDEIKVFHPESEMDRPHEGLGLPPDWDGLTKNFFIVNVNFGMFQTRLRLTQELGVEFIAQGRIWALRFYMGPEGKWHVRCSLSEHSMPVVNSRVNLAIRSHKPPPGSDTPEHLLLGLLNSSDTLVPKESSHYYTATEPGRIITALDHPLDDWPMDDDDIYVDCDGTLTIALIIRYLVSAGYCQNRGEE